MVAVKEEERREEVLEEEPVAAFHPGLVGQWWSWACTAPDMANDATGGGGAGTCHVQAGSRLPGTVAPSLDATGLCRPRQ